MYKWFTSCVQEPIDTHLIENEWMDNEQRGAKAKCGGTSDKLVIDRMVTMDCHRGDLSMAWVDVRKAYDTVDHKWLAESMDVHRFPYWLYRVIRQLLKSWNTKIIVRTKCGTETSRTIRFMTGLPVRAMRYAQVYLHCMKITHLLYIDDLKVF